MIKIIKEEIEIDESLVSRLSVICDFYNTTPIIENGSIRKIEHTNLKDVKELYKQEFEEARLEYNFKQIRDDRKIKDYYSKISNDTKHDLAV